MKKLLLGTMALGTILALNGCTQPDTAKYEPGTEVYECGVYTVAYKSAKAVTTYRGVTRKAYNPDTQNFERKRMTEVDLGSRGYVIVSSWVMKPKRFNLNYRWEFKVNRDEPWSFKPGMNNTAYLNIGGAKKGSLFSLPECKRIK